MKVSKDDLKEIVKQCLVEILSEGLGGSQIVESRTRAPERQQARYSEPTRPAAQERRQSVYDKMSFVPQKQAVQSQPAKRPNPLNMVKGITSDPILAGVLAETAATGQHLMMSERSSNSQPSHEEQVMSAGDAAARKMMQSDPTEIFGDSSSMWASLAFAEPIRK